MFDKIITFSSHEDYVNLKEDLPVPIKTNIPDWYKKLSHSPTYRTAKGCMPFLDTLTTGYLLKLPRDIYIQHNVENKETKKKDSFTHGAKIDPGYLHSRGLNINHDLSKDIHPIDQLKGSPHVEKNKSLPFYKILNPWLIKTPPGYSCLFLPPMNNTDDRFSIIPGIVDTDTFNIEINFPFLINGDKYPQLETMLKKGTPYVQIIPFKRDSWKMKIKKKKSNDLVSSKALYALNMFNVYKDKFWNKKSWK